MAKKKNDLSKEEAQSNQNLLDFPVVGIGASAGGLEALELFFSAMPKEPGAAFVVVQHLSPKYKSLMSELLSRQTSMVVNRVKSGMLVKPNEVFLIPAGKNMTIFNGQLLLTDQEEGSRLNLPIDIFLRSLAADQEKNAVGIILSGTGSDGTLGIRSIKENGGIAMVQDDKTAKFNGMPRSSISTGMVDFVLPPNQLAKTLLDYIQHPFVRREGNIEEMLDGNYQQFQQILAVLREVGNVDFSNYKDNTILRRLEKRISINRLTKVKDYYKFLIENEKEVNVLLDELLIGVTRFFRDESAFHIISDEVIPKLLSNPDKKEIRVWIAGCSTGEEAYSIAILFSEYISKNNLSVDVKIFATDLDKRSIEYAGLGLYPESVSSDIPSEYLARYFKPTKDGYLVGDRIRSMIIFAKHNIIGDPPFSKIDLLSCRNLLIYLKNDIQVKLIGQFYNSLINDAFLFLGSSESLGKHSEGFSVVNPKAKVFQKKSGYVPPFEIYNMGSVHKTRSDLSTSGLTSQMRTRRLHLENVLNSVISDLLPPSVIVDSSYHILHLIHDLTGILKFPVGSVNLNLLKLLPSELSVIVSSLLRRADKENIQVQIESFSVLLNEKKKTYDLFAKKLIDDKIDNEYYIVGFKDVTGESDGVSKEFSYKNIDINKQYEERLKELEKELQFKSENLQATVEELETSNEELQSSNEELIASNEELQSTNEELQSVNEELYTVNSEYVRKIDELTELNSDVDNLLSNTKIGVLFLDQELNIRKINDIASNLTNILYSDVGRPLEHLATRNLYKEFYSDVKGVLLNLETVHKELNFDSGLCYLMRIIPYRNIDGAINGVIITFVDITLLSDTRNNLTSLSARLQKAMEFGGISWWEWNVKKNIVEAGELKSRMLGYEHGSIGNTFENWVSLIHPDDKENAMQAMREHLSGEKAFYETEYRILSKDGKYLYYRDKGAVAEWEDGKPLLMTGLVMNVTDANVVSNHKNDNNAESPELNELLFSSKQIGVMKLLHDGQILKLNDKAKELININSEDKSLIENDRRFYCFVDEKEKKIEGKNHPFVKALKQKKDVSYDKIGYVNTHNRIIWISMDVLVSRFDEEVVFVMFTKK